jgi:hypothetical protein
MMVWTRLNYFSVGFSMWILHYGCGCLVWIYYRNLCIKWWEIEHVQRVMPFGEEE